MGDIQTVLDQQSTDLGHYHACDIEDELDRSKISLDPAGGKIQKENMRPLPKMAIKLIRKRIESAFSGIAQRFPAHVHPVTARGFELKIFFAHLGLQHLKSNDAGTTWVIKQSRLMQGSLRMLPCIIWLCKNSQRLLDK